MADIIKYGTKDRYFSDKNEKRIGRVSFFLRMLAILLMTILVSVAFNMILLNMGILSPFMITPAIIIIMSIIYALSVAFLVKKRAHDFDNNGRIFSYIVIASLVLNILLNIVTFYALANGNISMLLSPHPVMNLISYASMGIGIASLIVFIFLLFRPGTIGENTYGMPEQK